MTTPAAEPDLLLLDYGQLPQRVRVKTHGTDPLAVGPPMQFLNPKRSPEEVRRLASGDQQDASEMRLRVAQAKHLVSGAARRRRRAVQVLEQLDLGYPVQIPGGGSIIGFRLFRGARMPPKGLASPEAGWAVEPAAPVASPPGMVQSAASLASASLDARSARLAALGQPSESSSEDSSGPDDDPFGVLDAWADQHGDGENQGWRGVADSAELAATRGPTGTLASKTLRRAGGELLQPLQITNMLGAGQPAWLGKGRSAAGWQNFVTVRAPYTSARVDGSGGLAVAWKSVVAPSSAAKPVGSRECSRGPCIRAPLLSSGATPSSRDYQDGGSLPGSRASRRWSSVSTRVYDGPRPPARSWYAELGGSDALRMASALRDSVAMATRQLEEKRRLLAQLETAPEDARHRMRFLRDDVQHRERLLAQRMQELAARGFPLSELERAPGRAHSAGVGASVRQSPGLPLAAGASLGRAHTSRQSTACPGAGAMADSCARGAARPASLGRRRPALMVSYKAVETVDELPSTVSIPQPSAPRPFSSRLDGVGSAVPVLVEAPDIASTLFSAVDDLAASSGLTAAHTGPSRWLAPASEPGGEAYDSGRFTRLSASKRLPAMAGTASRGPPAAPPEPFRDSAVPAGQAHGTGDAEAGQLAASDGEHARQGDPSERVEIRQASAGADLQIFPAEADFGSIRVGTEYAFPLQVRNSLAAPRRIRVRQLEAEGAAQSRATHSLRARYRSDVVPGGRRTDVIILLLARTPGPVTGSCVIEGESGARVAFRVPIRAEALAKQEFAAAAEAASGLDQQVLAAAAEDLRPMNLSRAGDLVLGAGHDAGASVQSVTGVSPGPGPSPFAASSRSPAAAGLPWTNISPYDAGRNV